MNKYKLKKYTAFLIVFNLLIIGFSGFVSADKLGKVVVSERTDKDGDGYVSSFKVKANVDANVNEQGGDYRPFTAQGDPYVGVTLIPKGSQLYVPSGMKKAVGSISDDTSVELEYDYRFLEQKVNTYSDGRRKNDYRKIMEGEWPINRLKIYYYEKDWGTHNDNEDIDEGLVVLADELKLEKGSDDKLEDIQISSSPSSAQLYVNGESKGETPWSGQMPVDIGKRSGDIEVLLEKQGYHSLSENLDPNLPGSWDFEMKKIRKPLVVNSNVESAEVRVNGQKVGETPFSKEYWVEDSFDLRVEKEGYESKNFESVSAPRKIDANFDTGQGDTSDGLYIDRDLMDAVGPNEDLLSGVGIQRVLNAEFNASSKQVKSKQKIRFDASGSYDLFSSIDSYNWNFGDGNTASGKTTSHNYESGGNYTVNLTVENTNGSSTSKVKHIIVENLDPEPSFFLNQRELTESEPVTFNGSTSIDKDGSIVSYSWDMGDGTMKNGREVSHVYSTSGSYIVRLEVTDNKGLSTSLSNTIKVEKPNNKPRAKFSASSTDVEANESISFDASSSEDTDGTIDVYSWDFGNGDNKTGKRVEYSYPQSGNFTADLTVTDNRNESSSATRKIEVESSSETSETKNNTKSDGEKSAEKEEGDTLERIISFFASIF